MRVLHTSDWHIGRALYGRKRYGECESFLAWLADFIEREGIDVLLVSGDIFDSSTPSHRAQELYYRFLCRVAAPAKCHVVITAGNHDSPSFLSAPREILKFMNIHVVGQAMEDPASEVIVLAGREGEPRLLVCGIPYLRDRDIRTSQAGESYEDKERNLIAGIRTHYRQVFAAAEAQRSQIGASLPIVAMGHLFTAGGRTAEGDGVRELYIGSLAQVKADIFPSGIDYLALGHLHIPQKVAGADGIRYCGSPLPLGFSEGPQDKTVLLVEFSGKLPRITSVDVPRFRELKTIQGDLKTLVRDLDLLKEQESTAWLEIIYDGQEIAGSLRELLDAAIAGTGMEILRLKNNRMIEGVLSGLDEEEMLDDLNADEVFARCLAAHEVPPGQCEKLQRAYREIVASLADEDLNATREA